MPRRVNPPRRVRRKLFHDDYIYGNEVASPATANSSTEDDVTARGTSRSESESEPPFKFIVALDFGTTNTSVSYIKFDPEKPPTRLRSVDIKSICAWPDAASRDSRTSTYIPNVPSESWYRDGEYIWGYSVQRRIREFKSSPQDVIKFSKLLLGDNRESASPLNELLLRLNKTAREVITDYLIQIFTHTKKMLTDEESFKDSCAVELVLCIPAGWSIAAQRDMQVIVWDVVNEVNFGRRDFEPFIIHEPEAAAAHLLESTDNFVQLEENETFIICDAGGGTVDAITYRVTQVNPYRFAEVVDAAGRDCGSSRINEQMFQEATERLKDNELLKKVQKAPTDYIIHQEVLSEFEYVIKKEFTFDEYRGRLNKKIPLRILGLQQDKDKDLGEDTFYFTSERLARHFTESIEGTIELLSQQMEAAAGSQDVRKIILVGGFSSSDALTERVKEEFPEVQVIHKKIDMSTVVSHGAVFRALNKEDGPQRQIMASLGVLQHEIYDPNLRAHLLSSNMRHGMDGQSYVVEVIEWIIRKNQKLGKQASYRIIRSQQFDIDEKWIVGHRIYASLARVVRNHYHCDDEVNAEAEIAGLVVANLDEYRENGSIPSKRVEETDKVYFQVDYEVVLEVDGRNIRAKLFYPPGQECRDELKICIAAYFLAGTE